MTLETMRALAAAACASWMLIPIAARADSACMADAQRHCSSIPIGDGRVLTCLRSRWSELASACQQEIQRIDTRAQEISTACTTDIWQYCSSVPPGGDRIRVCLWSRWNDLSSTCRDAAARVAEKA